MGLAEKMFMNMLKTHGAPSSGSSRPGKAIKAGIWGLYFVLLYPLSVAILFVLLLSQPFLILICFPVLLILAIIPALIMTAALWLLWNVLLIFWPVKGLQICKELGKFELDMGEGWKFGKHLLKRKMALNMEDSSPHILVAGGSQTGKSSTLKTILMKLMEKPKHPKLEAIRQSILLILAFLLMLFVLLNYPLIALTPIMLAVYIFQSGNLTQEGVYVGLAVFGIGILSMVAALTWHVKRRYNAILEATEANRRNVILDYHGEYGFLADNGFVVIDARDYDPLAPNYEGESTEHIVSDFVNAFLVAFETTGDVQLAILKKKLAEKRDVGEALSAITADAQRARSYTEKDRLTGLQLRLEKIAAYRGSKAIQQLAKDSQNVVFDLSGIRDRDAADFFAENILSRYMARLTDREGGINIIIDEAHRLNTKPLAERGFEPTTIRIARESGKFGGRLIIASQNLTDFPDGFSANFGNIICFRTPAGTELQTLEKITGISYGLLQSVMNGLKKGEALLIGPKNNYSIIGISTPKTFPAPVHSQEVEVEEVETPAVRPKHPPHISRAEEILEVLKGTALTGSEIARRLNYPRQSIFRQLNSLKKKGSIIRYEETETPKGIEVFFEIKDPHRNESGFHKVLIAKAMEELKSAKELGGPSNPDLVFNNMAVEVETGSKPSLDGFVEQVNKRFEQGYSKVIVVVINQRHKVRYSNALGGLDNVEIMKLPELRTLV